MPYRGFVEFSCNPRPLLEICVEACVACLRRDGNLATAALLPPCLKSSLLELATAQGVADEGVLRALLHRDTRSLSLRGGRVDDRLLGVVASSRCHGLTLLYLDAPPPASDDLLSAAGLLELIPSLGRLRELHLRRRRLAVDDDVLGCVARSCPQLQTLDVGGCSKVTDKAMFALKDLEHLVTISVSSSQVGNLGILALSEGRSQESLRELIMDRCLGVTGFAVNTALKLLPNLTYISFHGCPVSGSFVSAVPSKLRDISWTIS